MLTVALIGTQDPPFSHGFFDRDKETVAARKIWFTISMGVVGQIIFIILGILSIYWAALGRSYVNIHNLSGYVVVSSVTHSFRTFFIKNLTAIIGFRRGTDWSRGDGSILDGSRSGADVVVGTECFGVSKWATGRAGGSS